VSKVFNIAADVVSIMVAQVVAEKEDTPSLRLFLGGADIRTSSIGKLGGALDMRRVWIVIPM
jgi:hypothetical protein